MATDDDSRKPWHSLLAAFLTLVLILLVLAGLYVLTLGTIGLAILVGGGAFVLVAFHYFVWGWWLGPAIHRQVEEEERAKERQG